MLSFLTAQYQKTEPVIAQAQAGIPRTMLNDVATLSGLSKHDIATLIGLSERAIYKTTEGSFSVLVSEHLLLLKHLFKHGLAVFDGNKKVLTKWLHTPNAELATPESGFYSDSLNQSIPALNQLTSFEPVDLMAHTQQHQQAIDNENVPKSEPLSYPTPISLLNTSTGIGLVDAVFTRIESGVFY